ncbi:D-alanyl-D-alanine carboxypeptidase family protein [Clostridium carnis]
MKKFVWKFFLALFIISNLFTFDVNATSTVNTVPTVEAAGVVLMDGITGEVIYSKNPDVQYEPASTTKVMTALVTLEHTNLNDKVTIGEKPPLVDGSAIGLGKGQIYTVRELLLGLLLESGNDCAEALAEHVAGSNEAFGKLMTKKAKELGAKNTVFKNPSGLHEKGHITTPYDLSLIMKAAIKNPNFVELSRTPYYIFESNPNFDGTEKWANNKNHLLNSFSPYYYEYAYSGKTGYTPEANHTYTATAVKDGQVLVASFLNAVDKDKHFNSIAPLFNYGFENFETIKLISKDEAISEYKINDNITLPLVSDSDVYYTKSKNEERPAFSVKYDYLDITKQAISKGEDLFTGNILINNKKYTTVELLSGSNREFNTKIRIKEAIDKIKNNPKSVALIVVVSLILLLIIYFLLKYKNRTKRIKRIKRKFNLH